MALPGERVERNPADTRAPVHPVSAPGSPGAAGDPGGPTLGFYLEAVSEGRWIILACLVVAGLVLAWILGTQVPLYEADVVLQIEDRRQSGSLGIANLDGPQA